MNYHVDVVSKRIQEQLVITLDQMGIMYRIFGRVKSNTSLMDKISKNPNYGNEKLIQDLIGIRIVLYFVDDVKVVHKAISRAFQERKVDQSIDHMSETTFKPVRYNLVYNVPQENKYELSPEISQKVDCTFELQIRTVLSEGWHEVEHDLRYKHQDDWNEFPVESRMLNGVYASLETNEWTMIKIFEEISYGHYKRKNWESMIRQKFRLRLANMPLNEKLISIFDNDYNLAKKFYRIDRTELISLFHEKKFDYPLNISNIIYFANLLLIKDEDIVKITPSVLVEEYDNFQTNCPAHQPEAQAH
jgi:ppGpp synthetase/RelA/SpoT-type nucleotidyltranferase